MSLDLDDRQRAMLLEMGVRVWGPRVASPLSVESGPAQPAQAAPGVVRLPTPGVSVRTEVAIENIALEAISTRTRGQFGLKSAAPAGTSAVPAGLADGIAAMDWTTLALTVAACQACKLCVGRRAPVFGAADAAAAPAGASTVPAGLADGIAAMDWTTLVRTVAACQACKLCVGRRAPVIGAADAAVPPPADWLIVGEPPDESEERAGLPLVDQAGQLLDNMLRAVGVRRRGVLEAGSGAGAAYVTNVVKCRPALVRNPAPHELETCAHYLQREIALVQPRVILAMGRFAAQTLLRDTVPDVAAIPLGKLRGQVYRYQGIPVVVTYHPTYLLRTQHDKARAWADLCLALDAVS